MQIKRLILILTLILLLLVRRGLASENYVRVVLVLHCGTILMVCMITFKTSRLQVIVNAAMTMTMAVLHVRSSLH